MNIPSFTSAQIHALIPELDNRLKGLTCLACAPADPSRFLLLFEGKGRREALLLCLPPPLLRFHLTAFPSLALLAAPFHPLQSTLEGTEVQAIEQLNEDRILKLTFRSPNRILHLIVECFNKHPNYYLTNEENKILFSLFPLAHSHYQLPTRPLSSPASLRLLNDSREVEKVYDQLEKNWLFQKEKQAIKIQLQQRLKRMQKGKLLLEQELEACCAWKAVQHEGELLKANFHLLKKGLINVNVWDWQQERFRDLALNPQHTPQEELAKRFRRSKKLQAGLSHVRLRLSQIQVSLKEQELQLETLESVQNEEGLHPFKPKIKSAPPLKKEERLKLPYQEYRSAAGLAIWVGKNARSNERLTFSLAKGSDWWLHAQGVSGSHVVIRTQKGQEPDPETLADAIQLALYHSKAKDRQEAEICITQRKYVSHLGKNQPGKVQISKHKVLWVRFDRQRHQALKQRQTEKIT